MSIGVACCQAPIIAHNHIAVNKARTQISVYKSIIGCIDKIAHRLTRYRDQSRESHTSLERPIPSARALPLAKAGTMWQLRSTFLGSTKPNACSSAIGGKRIGSMIKSAQLTDLLRSYSNHRTHKNSTLRAV